MKSILIIAGILIAVVLVAGCATTTPPGPTQTTTPTPTATATSAGSTVIVASQSMVGSYLATPQGETLYYFARDVPDSGTSACAGACESLWPAFPAGTISVQPPLVASDFGTIMLTSGSMQTTYRGWPLYLYSKDSGPGQTNGNGYLSIWYVMNPGYTVMIMDNSTVGPYLSDPAGMTLYVFSHDTPGSGASACSGTCQSLWPPFYAGTIISPTGAPAADFSSIQRTDGSMQTTYKGLPLYYYSKDTKPGELSGHGYLDIWSAGSVGAGSPNLLLSSSPATTVPTTTIATYSYPY
jgi:predicted lipoprotein with Yx(FWY)xxD motif